MEGDDSVHMYTALMTLFLITNTFFWKVMIMFLSNTIPAFKKWREECLSNKRHIFTNSMFDMSFTICPIMAAWTYYEQIVELHMMLLCGAATLILINN